MNQVIIYSPYTNNKLEYVCHFVFVEYLGLNYVITNERNELKESSIIIKIDYSDVSGSQFLHIPNKNYLDDFNVNEDVLFEKHLKFDSSQSNFDLFAAVFFNLARVEEYRPYTRDIHNRFISSNSILVKRNLIQFPIIDIWLKELKLFIESYFKVHLSSNAKYQFISTIDIDHIFAYRNKPWLVRTLSFCKDLLFFKFGRIADRFEKQDPYDTFEDFVDIHKQNGIQAKYFVLCAQRNTYDKTFSFQHPDFIDKINYLSQHSDIGMHPSYYSNSDSKRMTVEKENLESVIGQSIDFSRQHFLRLNFPATYRALLDIGIKEDYSMAFHDLLGFRAGTTRTFFWYDLERDSQTDLSLIPFQIMDVSMKNYLGWDTNEALTQSKMIVDRIKEYEGSCCIVWHNSSFYSREGWKNWKEFYIQFLSYAK